MQKTRLVVAICMAATVAAQANLFSLSIWVAPHPLSTPLSCSLTTQPGILGTGDFQTVTEGCNCADDNTRCSDYTANGDGTYAISFFPESNMGCGSQNKTYFLPRVLPDGTCSTIDQPCPGAPSSTCSVGVRFKALRMPTAKNCPWNSDGALVGEFSQSNPGCQCIAETVRAGGFFRVDPNASTAIMTTTVGAACQPFVGTQAVGQTFAFDLSKRSAGAAPGSVYSGSTGRFSEDAGAASMSIVLAPTTTPHKSWALVTGLLPFGGVSCKTTVMSDCL